MERQKTARYIYQLRKEKNLTQKQLAEKVYVTDKAVSKWERGLGTPDVSLLPLLAGALGVTADDILNGGPISRLDNVDAVSVSVGESTQAERENAPAIGVVANTVDGCDTNSKAKRFIEKRHVRVFIIMPIIWACLFSAVSILYIISTILADISIMPIMFLTLLFPWFVFSSVTGFIPLAICYAWHRLSPVKK